jgi:hypothetical protein
MPQRFEEISAAFAEPDADFDKLMDEQARVQERIDTLDLWNLDNKIQIAMEALRLPPDDADVSKLSRAARSDVSRCAACCSSRHLLPRILLGQLLVLLDAALRLGLPRARRHPHPLELTRSTLSASRWLVGSSSSSMSAPAGDHHPAAAAARQRRGDREVGEEGVRRQGAVRRSHVLAAARRHRRRDRPERGGEDDAVPNDRRRGLTEERNFGRWRQASARALARRTIKQ